MKKLSLFLSLISMILVVAPQTSFAKKKYRYIKREHGLRVNWHFPGQFMDSQRFTDNLNFNFTYTYNWKGFVEVGPYLAVKTDDSSRWMVNTGLLVEWNIIKNRGKRKFIPAVGLKLGGDDLTGNRAGHYGFPLSMKYFVAKRTPLIVTFEPYMEAANFTGFSPLIVKYNFTGGFSYYFDIY